MVAKISRGKNLIGAILYNQEKLEKGEAEIFLTNRMINVSNTDTSVTLSQVMKGFEVCLANNNRTKNPVIHLSLNPDPRDNISNEDLKLIANQYMSEMGYGNQPYIAYLHKDIDRNHLHIVSVRVDENGVKIDDSFEHKKSMRVCRKLEEDYKLHSAESQQRERKEPLKKIDYKRGDIKHQISNVVKSLASSYSFQSFNEFRTLLECYNVSLQEVKGVAKDKPYHGILYTTTDEDKNAVGVPIKSSLIGKSVGSEALIKQMNKSAKHQNQHTLEGLKLLIQQASIQGRTKTDFIKNMKANGVDVVFRENDKARIYGVTFIDHSNKIILNGYRLGKEYSANAFNSIFNEGIQSRQTYTDNSHRVEGSIPSGNHQKGDDNSEANSLANLFSILPEPNEAPVDDRIYIPKKKKKRKRRIR